ncbi:MAG: hypothetical protein ACD_73C00087G0001 [uncultured bacterium]|nr:MAG: hypothetical protein ACD_73C00087G0001 [uncultured bacterium]
MGLISIAPHLEKSGRLSELVLGKSGDKLGAPILLSASATFTKFLTSSLLIRPLEPLPTTFARSTPISRAKALTEGPANISVVSFITTADDLTSTFCPETGICTGFAGDTGITGVGSSFLITGIFGAI